MDFAAYKYIAEGLVLIEIGILLLFYQRNPKLAIYATLVSVALKGQYIWLGKPIYAWQIAALLGLMFVFARQSTRALPPAGRALSGFNATMNLYFTYTLVVSVPMWIMFTLEGLGTSTTGVSLTRITTQLIYFMFLVGLYGFGKRAGRYLTTFGLIRALVTIATVVAYFALIQVAVRNLMGINLFPIIGSDDSIRSAYLLNSTFRATSFAGEPKHLGILMSIGLTAFYVARLFSVPMGGRLGFHRPLVMVAAVLLSLSTTGIALTVAGIALASILFFPRLRLYDFIMLSVVAVVVTVWMANAGSDFVGALDRQLSKNEIEVQDESVRLALLANPMLLVTGTGLGNIHLLAVDYLPEAFPLFRDSGYKANSGLFFILGDSGLIGLLLFVLPSILGVQAYLRERPHMRPEARKEAAVGLALVFLTLVNFLLRYDVLYFLVSGFVYTRLVFARQTRLEVQRSGHHAFTLSRAEPRTSGS